MKLIVLTGLPTKEKELLTRDLATHYMAEGQRVAVLDNANVSAGLSDVDGIQTIVSMRGGCACCSVAGKLFKTVASIGVDTDIAIMPADNQTHIGNLAGVLDNLVNGSSTPIEVVTVALVDDRTTCCFPYMAETLTDYANVTLQTPFSAQDIIDRVGSTVK